MPCYCVPWTTIAFIIVSMHLVDKHLAPVCLVNRDCVDFAKHLGNELSSDWNIIRGFESFFGTYESFWLAHGVIRMEGLLRNTMYSLVFWMAYAMILLKVHGLHLIWPFMRAPPSLPPQHDMGLLDLHLYRLTVDEVAAGDNSIEDNSNLSKISLSASFLEISNQNLKTFLQESRVMALTLPWILTVVPVHL